MSGGTAQQVIAQFAHEQAHEIADLEYFEDLVRGVVKHTRELDAALADSSTAKSSRSIRSSAPCCASPPMNCGIASDVPYRVVINEAIDTTKRFGSEHGHTYVNGVLDHAAAAWRAAEFSAARRIVSRSERSGDPAGLISPGKVVALRQRQT